MHHLGGEEKERLELFRLGGAWLLDREFWKQYEKNVAENERWQWLSSIHLNSSERAVHYIARTMVFAFELALVILNVVLVADYGRVLQPGGLSETFEWSDWTFGQVISVAIWAPVIAEYAWKAFGKFCKPKDIASAIDCCVASAKENHEAHTPLLVAHKSLTHHSDEEVSSSNKDFSELETGGELNGHPE